MTDKNRLSIFKVLSWIISNEFQKRANHLKNTRENKYCFITIHYHSEQVSYKRKGEIFEALDNHDRAIKSLCLSFDLTVYLK